MRKNKIVMAIFSLAAITGTVLLFTGNVPAWALIFLILAIFAGLFPSGKINEQ